MANRHLSDEQLVKEIAFKTGINESTVAQIPQGNLRDVFNKVEKACVELQTTTKGYLAAAFSAVATPALGYLATVIPNFSQTSMPTGARVAEMAILTGLIAVSAAAWNYFDTKGKKEGAATLRDDVRIAAGEKPLNERPYVPVTNSPRLPS